jgi:Ran GTPase-activating protein (RanGAP) involved in mRNA processing and transport
MLTHNQTLKKMLLSSNLLGDRAVVELASALAVNSGLEMLLIADNPFGDEGGQQLTSVLCRTNRTLRVLDLHSTHMTKAVEREVVKDLYQYSSLRKLGSAFGTRHSATEGLAKREAQQRQEQHFHLQATSPSSNLY